MEQTFNFEKSSYWYELRETVSKLFEKSKYTFLAEMTCDETAILMGLIKEYNIKNIVEIGVAEGGTSCCILQALTDMTGDNRNLYSVDKDINCYTNSKLKVGYLSEEYKKLTNSSVNHITFYGKYLIDVINDIPNNIDLVVIDAWHLLPGDLFNTLIMLNKLHIGSFLYYHDTIEYARIRFKWDNLPSASMISILGINGEKHIPTDPFLSCGIARCTQNTFTDVDNLFYALLLQFQTDDTTWEKTKEYLIKTYPKYKEFLIYVFHKQKEYINYRYAHLKYKSATCLHSRLQI